MSYLKIFFAFFTEFAKRYKSAKASGNVQPWHQIVRRTIGFMLFHPARALLCAVVLLGFSWDEAVDMWERTS